MKKEEKEKSKSKSAQNYKKKEEIHKYLQENVLHNRKKKKTENKRK